MTDKDEQIRYAKSLATALTEALNYATDGANTVDPIIAKVGVRKKDALLYVALESVSLGEVEASVSASQFAENAIPADLEPSLLLPRLRQALTQLETKLSLQWVKLVSVSGRLPGQATPCWQEDLILSAAASIVQTLTQPTAAMPDSAEPKPSAEPDGEVSVRIGGNFSGNLIVGDGNQLHNYTYHVAHGGVLNVASPPTIKPRPVPLALKPKPIAKLLDRQTILPILRESLAQKSSVELYAEAGFGKTALMRHLSYEGETIRGFSDGVVYLPTGNQPAGDLLQSLYDVFYEAAPPFKPSYGQAQQALQIKDALVILDGLTLDKDQGEGLLTALRGSTFVLVSPSKERLYWQDGEGIALQGLPFPESTALMQIELGRALTETEKVAAKELWISVAGNPLQLRRVAAQVKAHEQSFEAFVASRHTMLRREATDDVIFQQIEAKLTPEQKKMLALLGAMGGVALSAEQTLAITQMPASAQILNELTQQHLLQTTASNHYQLSADLLEIVPQSIDLQPWLEQATAYFSSQGASAADPSSAEAMMHLLEWTQRTGQWQSSIDLARNLDPMLSLTGQWEQWHQVLTTSLQAAEQAGDQAAFAWAQHQLGTRALAVGEPTQAASLLSQALRLREQLGDVAGAAVSRHNLGLIVPPLVAGTIGAGATGTRTRRFAGKVAVIAGLVLGGSIATGLAVTQPWNTSGSERDISLSETVIDFGARSLNSASDPRGVTLANDGQQPVRLGDASLSATRDFRLSRESTCQVELILAPGDTCEILAVFRPSAEGDRTAEISLSIDLDNSDSNNSDPDNRRSGNAISQTITLTGKGEAESLPSVNFDTSQLDFGEVFIGQTVEETTEITNDGDAPLEIGEITVTGRGTSKEYTVVSDETCTEKTLLPDAACSVVLRFKPEKEGERAAKLQIKSNTETDSELILIGIGKAKPVENGETPEPNAVPVAEDDSAAVASAGAVFIDVLKNDSEGAQLADVAPGSVGRTEIRDNQIVYTHSGEGGGEGGRDRFTYTITNSEGKTAQATVNIQITSSPVPPPEANDDSATVRSGDSVVINVLANDSDNVSIINVGPGQFGTTEVDDGEIIYSHNGDSMSERFTYTVRNSSGETAEATVSISVERLPAPVPEARGDRAVVIRDGSVLIDVLANDSDPAGGSLRIVQVEPGAAGGQTAIEGNQVAYYATGRARRDSFTYTIENSAGNTAQATVSISVEEPEATLEAVDDTASVQQWGAVEIDVLANDINPAGGRLRVLNVGESQLGETEITGNTITYYYSSKLIRHVPDSRYSHRGSETSDRGNYPGLLVQITSGERDYFTYTIGNDAGETAQATVYITIISQTSQ